MLLSAADLPDGWAERSDGGNDALWEQCSGQSHPGRTGEATTETFYGPDGATSLTESVVIYETADGLRSEMATLGPTFDCLVTQMSAGVGDTGDVAFSDASFVKTLPPEVGDKADAYRVRFRVHDKSGATPDSDGYVDGIYVVVGRVGVSIDGNGVGLPLDSALLDSVVQSAIAKVHQP